MAQLQAQPRWRNHGSKTVVAALTRVRDREYARAIAEFEAQHAKPYDGSSDHDWDRLDKSFTAVDEAIDSFEGFLAAEAA